ncbi:MAG: phosphate ABC transporter ATP-binding protein PstB [Armatimonadetes bacterium]|nr:phosphate ABC transporter ATP-binding protein PstB [Armatimonadota bacterium]
MGNLLDSDGVGVDHQPILDTYSQQIQEEVSELVPDVTVRNISSWYGSHQVLFDVSMQIPAGVVTAFIGPSGCGKSTMLRCLNRLNDRISGFRLEGEILVGQDNPYRPGTDLLSLRRDVGIVFQKPNPFPKSIFENIAIGLRAHYGFKGKELEDRVVDALQEVALWEEVKDSMHKKSGLSLSGGQQQRLCIARMLSVRPKVILMDEPCSALDPISTKSIEQLITKLAGSHTVVIVTHNLQQAQRVSDYTAFFLYGKIEEHGLTHELFANAQSEKTREYIAGAFG